MKLCTSSWAVFVLISSTVFSVFQVDIFSFGMFMFELLTCRAPLQDINNPAVHVCNGGRPNITSEVRKFISGPFVLETNMDIFSVEMLQIVFHLA